MASNNIYNIYINEIGDIPNNLGWTDKFRKDI